MNIIKNNRLYYRVTLKLLTLVAVLVLLGVFINSLFVGTDGKKPKPEMQSLVILDTSLMKKGEIRKTRWNGKEVAVLLFNNPQSEKNYFVYENYGDSGNCPLFYVNNTFKDVCTGSVFDTSGRLKNNPNQGYRLKEPPYYFQNNTVVFGTKIK